MTGFPLQIAESVRRRLATLGVRPEEVDERFVRGTGPGGQKINKTSSTVWLRHHPTAVEIRCQAGRSQAANRERAWTELAEKLEQRRRQAVGSARAAREAERRRTRQKSRGQKARMVDDKRRRARTKQARRWRGDE